MASKRGLGRGLDALFADQAPVIKEEKLEEVVKEMVNGSEKAEKIENNGESVVYIELHDIKPNGNQPRKAFDDEKLSELASSIIEHGIIQPIVVRKNKDVYEIVAGERRWRAARKAGLKSIPCLVREFTDEQNMLVAIIENMQREDLNPVEEAEGINQMVKKYGLTQEEVSKSLGKSRPYITNSLRLLRLPSSVQEYLTEGVLTTGHVRTLITINDEDIQLEICKKIKEEGLSVRETEKLVARITENSDKPRKTKIKDSAILKVEEELKTVLGTKVKLKEKGNKGKIEIAYFSKEELERIIELLKNAN